jgi:hypothetical protein
MPLTCDGAGSLWPDVAWRLTLLAPNLAGNKIRAMLAQAELRAACPASLVHLGEGDIRRAGGPIDREH